MGHLLKNLKSFIVSFILIFSIHFFIIPDIHAGVNPDGSFSHSVPIKVPPGRKGVQPKLALVYNSNSGNGMLGVGWNLAGLSYITRDPAFGINYDGTDHYIHSDLGQLVDIGGGIYHSRKESFTKIVPFYGGCGDGICYWEATDKSGVKYYYGGSSSDDEGRIEAVDRNGSVRVWALSKVKDLHGNYYEIYYDEDTTGGDYYPSSIEYTKGGGLKYHKIEFVYENRSDHYPEYSFSAKVDRDMRLKLINVKTNTIWGYLGDQVHKFELFYEYGQFSNKSRLIKILKYGQDETSILERNFNWSDRENNHIYSWYDQDISGFGDQNGRPWFSGDFNGDGVYDIV